jgi:acetyl esterase/lipase
MWMAEDRSFSSTDVAGELMRLVAGVLLLRLAFRRPHRTRGWPVSSVTGSLPAVLLAGGLSATGVSFNVNSDTPPPAVSPVAAPAGQMTALAYCSIGAVRLAMDLYQPRVQASRPDPAVQYLHGGVWLAGGRGPDPYFR